MSNAGVRRRPSEDSEDEGRIGLSNYEWVPPAPSADLARKYMAQLPESTRPIVGTEGADKRKQAIDYQLPLHDCDPSACVHKLDDEDKETMGKYLQMVKDKVVGQGEVYEVGGLGDENLTPDGRMASKKPCNWCDDALHKGEVAIKCKHGRPLAKSWHANCFKCETCKEPLIDMLYFHKEGKYYCGRHFADTCYPRCNGCDELIFSAEYTRAEEKDWHLNHFCCFGCDLELGGHRYMEKNENWYCIDCYMSKFARTCQTCQEKIKPDVERISHHDMHWHNVESCFRCCNCLTSLTGKKFLVKGGNLLCSVQCKDAVMKKL